jgi:hypothetical protein
MLLRSWSSQLLVALGVLVGGCASVDAQRASLAIAVACCSSVADTNIEPMTSSTMSLVIDERAAVGTFAVGNSRYRILDLSRLPARPAVLSVKSVGTVTNVYTGGKSWAPVFYPAVTFLNSQKETLVTVSEDKPQNPSLSCKALLHCGFAIINVEVPAEASFVVLHTPFDKVGQTREEALPGKTSDQTYLIGGTFVTIPGGSAPALRTIGMSVGELEVRALSAK